MIKLKRVVHFADTNSLEATWEDIDGAVVKCHSYADLQMGMFRDDVAELGGNIADYENMIAEIEAAIVPPPAPTAEQIIALITQATQQRLDDFARTRNYDGILSASTYATSTIPKFQAEGQYAVNARDNTWATLYALMDDVMAGKRQMPESFDDVEPILPQLTWPS